MSAGLDSKETTNLERLIEDRFNKVYEKLRSLESKYDRINFSVERLKQDSSDLLGVMEEMQNSVEAIKASTSKTNRFIRRISPTHDRTNDFSWLIQPKQTTWFGSTDSLQTRSASRESDTDSCQEEKHGKRRKNSRRRRVETRRHSPPTDPPRPNSNGFDIENLPKSENTYRNNDTDNQRKERPLSPPEINKNALQPADHDSNLPENDGKTQSLHTTEPQIRAVPEAAEGPPKEILAPVPSPVDYQSPERFLESLYIHIEDPALLSALNAIFNDTAATPQLPTGLYTLLLIDVSHSVHMSLFKQIQAFIEQMVNDVEASAADHNLEEMLAVMKFGGQCEVIKTFTNDYMPVKDSLHEKIIVGGKSPLMFGLAMALAYCNKFGKRVKVNGQIINPRIIVFTDGYATDIYDKQACLGQDYETNSIKVQSDIFKFLAVVQNCPVTINCVGVGECQQVFLHDIAKCCHGQFYSLSGDQNPSKLGRYYLYQNALTRTKNALSQGGGHQDLREAIRRHSQGSHYSDEDREEILKLLQLDLVYKTGSAAPFSSKEGKPPTVTPVHTVTPVPTPVPVPSKPSIPLTPPKHTDGFNKTMKPVLDVPNIPVPPNSSVPPSPITSEVDVSDGELFNAYGQPLNRCHPWGTRVIRGENWKWPEDQNMPGTVVAHKSEGVVVVKWDSGAHGEYPQENLFRISESRALKRGEAIAVGCSVKRGPDWKRGDEDGGPSTVGTVIRKHSNNSVSVVWPFGVVDVYRYEEGNKELEVVQNDSAPSMQMSMAVGPPVEGRVPDTGEPRAGEVVLWQWIDGETNELHTFTKDEAFKLEEVYKKKTGTTLVGYKGQQLRCQPMQWKYRDCGGKGVTGILHRKVCSHDEAETFYLIETM